MNKRVLKMSLKRATGCDIQHNGWPCGTCFFAMSKKLTNSDWQGLLLYRGDYKEKELKKLPKDREKSLEKIYEISKKVNL